MRCEEVQDKLDELAFDLIEEPEKSRIEDHLAECPRCREARERAGRRRESLRQWQAPAPPEDLRASTLKRIRNRIEEKAMTYEPVEPKLSWLGNRRFWGLATAALLLLAIGLTGYYAYLATREAKPQEAVVLGRWAASPGQPASFRVFVRNGKTSAPVPEARVGARLVAPDGNTVWEGESTSDTHGIAQVQPDLAEDLPEGDYTLRVKARSNAGRSVVSRKLTVERSFRVMVSSDKPLYQPGQTIHIRTLSLFTADLRPVDGKPVTIEVQDSKGNKVFKKMVETSRFGIASADFQLADQVNTGRYTLAAHVGDTTSERTVTVERYRLPKYKVEVSTDKLFYRPGETVSGEITTRYTFGKPVRGADVEVVASEFVEKFRPFATIDGKTNEEGRFSFEIPLKRHFTGTARKRGDATVSLEATVTDTAGHTQKSTRDLMVTTRPIRVAVLPESGKLVPGVENVLYVLTSYPDGRPARTTLRIGADRKTVRTSAGGLAKVTITPHTSHLKLTIEAEDPQGRRVEVSRPLRVDRQVHAFLLRTDEAVYQAGDTAQLTVLSGDRRARVFVDVVKNRQTMLSRSLDVRDGRGHLALDLPPDLFGTLEINAYRILPDGNIVSDARVVQVNRPDQLSIQAEMDKETYRPGGRAMLEFLVTGKNGEPTQAALGLSGVDEAVFALQEMRPGLERVYFMLQEEILKPAYEIHGHMPVTAEDAVTPRPTEGPERKEATVALFSAAEGWGPPAQQQSESFTQKQVRYRRHKESYATGLSLVLAHIPPALYFLLTVPVLGYAVYRLFHRDPVKGLDRGTSAELKRATRGLTGGWFLALVLPPVSLVVGLLAGAWVTGGRGHLQSYRELLAVGSTVLAALVMFVALIALVIRFRHVGASTAVPLFRKLATMLPVAYLMGAASLVTVVVAMEELGLDEEMGLLVLIAVPLIGMAMVPALSIAGHCAWSRVSVKRWFWLLAGRGAALLIPLLLIGAWQVKESLIMRSPPRAGRQLEAATEIREKGSVVAQDTPAPAGEESGEQAGQGLQAPTRVREYFPETLLWQPQLITNQKGRAQLELPLADSITTWRISMSAVSGRGELGADTMGLRVFQDFFVDIDFPVALTQHDEVSVPIAVYNYLDKMQEVRLEVEQSASGAEQAAGSTEEGTDWCEIIGDGTQTLRIGPQEVTSVHLKLRVLKPGRHTLTVKAYGSEMADAVRRQVRVRPDGREVVQTINGRLSGKLNRTVRIPEEAIDGASDLLVKIYPGAFSQVMEGLDSIFRKPFGCFEQTSSVTYPNVLVLDYMRRTDQAKPEIEMKALNYINLGYQRLLSYEVDGGGFAWFGNAPAHNVLTAYGLMEFNDMAKVYEVDPAVIRRTRRWLYSRQKSNGSWEPSEGGIAEGAINAYQGAVLRTTAYIAWALAESGEVDSNLRSALDYVEKEVGGEKDAYTLAVCANALVASDRSGATRLLDRLDEMKESEGELVHWSSASEGVTHSRGNVLDIETTALVAYAMLQFQPHIGTANKALAWLIEQKDPHGTWHSTQATVHAMRALLAGTGPAAGKLEKDLPITISVNGKPAEELTVTPETSDVFRLISLREHQREGENRISIEPAGEADLAYQIVATHYLPWERRDPAQTQKVMSIDVDYDTRSLAPEDLLTCRATIRYNRPGTAKMTIVDLGLPPGFDVVTADFDRLKDEGLIQRYSVTGRQVILYFESIPGNEPVEFTYHLRAKYPVKAKTPPTEIYQYYEPDLRDETEPVEIEVREREGKSE